MAVKAAVVGYDEFLEPLPEGTVEEDITDKELDEVDKKDLEGLILNEEVDFGGDELEDDSLRKSPLSLEQIGQEGLLQSTRSTSTFPTRSTTHGRASGTLPLTG